MLIIIQEFENLYLSLYLMAKIATHPYTKWQKSRPIPIPELKNCDPSERHPRTRHFLGVNPPGFIAEYMLNKRLIYVFLQLFSETYEMPSESVLSMLSSNFG